MDKFEQRLKDLFADIEQLSEAPDLDVAAMRRELDALRARVREIELGFLESQKGSAAVKEIVLEENDAVGPAALLYEKDRLGYACIDGHLEPLAAGVPDNLVGQRVITVPLTEIGQAVGAMYIEPQADQPWSPADSDLAAAVAQQVSLKIQNLRLLAAAERARAEAQAATRRFTHESWQAYLDAIQRDEHIGYAYDQSAVTPFMAARLADADLEEAVAVMDEQVGRLYLKADPANPLSEADKTLVQAVASQVAQQVENLRLLADASRARADAEEANRRLSRDSWKGYLEHKGEENLAFVYDLNRVAPVTAMLPNVNLAQPLTVRGEAIGEMVVAGLEDLPPEAADLVAAVAAQASLHLEALRLNEELQRRAIELQELDRLKSSFLANMSHELRTPLNSILGFSDVMLEGIDGPLTEYMSNDLRIIQKNGQHLLHLINDVLDMAKIQSGRMNLHPEKIRLQDIFEEVTSITSTLASEKNLALFIEPDSNSDIEVVADVTRIRQVMINLVNNSIKFTEQGKVMLRADALGSDRVRICVSDTGIGIPADQLEKVFEEFSQVDTSTTRKAGGTGLGLPISRRLVEMHGGRMWAESSGVAGEGSHFYIELPLEAQVTDVVEKLVK